MPLFRGCPLLWKWDVQKEKSQCKNENESNLNPDFSFFSGYLFCQRFPKKDKFLMKLVFFNCCL